ncbi:MAG: NYN domain-containing protein [Chloroflexi bacterium]|nr:NYN domain-containing protein [Chloroflexota bacterium]
MPSKSSTKSVTRDNERVMVFIDGSNLYHVLTQSSGRHDLQFDKFAFKLANGRDLKRIYYYNIRQESDTNPNMGVEQQKFLDSLNDTPYVEVRLGIWKQRGDIMVEKGVDVMLATDLVIHAYKDHYDTAIVVSGDADFYPALQAVKDVGKHVEVAAFDMNMSAESGRVADVTIKLNKTYFTGLWMSRSQVRSRATAAARPEVSDEAASPNGEDKAATKAATARRSGSRKPASTATRTRRTPTSGSGSRTRKPAASKVADRAETRTAASTRAPDVTRAPRETAAEESRNTGMRRTPTRRRVGGTSSGSGTGNGARNGRTTPKPPPLRTTTESKPDSAQAEPAGSTERRRSWRDRLGLSNTDE